MLFSRYPQLVCIILIPEDAGRLSERELYEYRHFGKEISAFEVPSLGRSGNLNLT